MNSTKKNVLNNSRQLGEDTKLKVQMFHIPNQSGINIILILIVDTGAFLRNTYHIIVILEMWRCNNVFLRKNERI